jgi:hypothetical protein
MELELARHPWRDLRTPHGRATSLAPAIRALSSATSDAEADAAVEVIDQIMFANGLLCEASPALAECLVHALTGCSDIARTAILGILADISDGAVDEIDPGFLVELLARIALQ